jgi:hypothetical protein
MILASCFPFTFCGELELLACVFVGLAGLFGRFLPNARDIGIYSPAQAKKPQVLEGHEKNSFPELFTV